MKQLMLLILCLLVASNVTSQIDIKNKYVVLTEKQAKSIIKDLIHMDALEKINAELDERILILLKKEFMYQMIILNKDSIISNKDEIIRLKDKMLKAKNPIQLHSYVGIETFNIKFDNLSIFYRVQLELDRINVGVKFNYQPVPTFEGTNRFYSNINLEYKIF